MTPRRVLPYLALFLVLVGVYLGLNWRQERRETREQEAKKLFAVNEADVSEFAVIKGKDEIRVVKKGQEWRLTRPLEARADQDTVKSVLVTLRHMPKERDLGAAEGLKPFGLDHPGTVVEFTLPGQVHRLALGAPAPGGRDYYALKDQDRRVVLISAGDKDSLDRPLTAFRDKALFSFTPDKVKTLQIKTGQMAVSLERTGPEAWRGVGREGLRLRADRVEALLRQLDTARVKEFVADAPKDLKSYGLAPPPRGEIILTTDQGREILDLGNRTPQGAYARRRPGEAVVLIDSALAENLTKTASQLEDRRLWAGPVSQVHKAVWGAPDKPWTGVKDKDAWKLTGPDQQELNQPAVRMESAFAKFTQVEYHQPRPALSGKKESYRLELYDGAGRLLFRLEDWGETGNQVEVRTRVGDETRAYLVPGKAYRNWQEDMTRLTAASPGDNIVPGSR